MGCGCGGCGDEWGCVFINVAIQHYMSLCYIYQRSMFGTLVMKGLRHIFTRMLEIQRLEYKSAVTRRLLNYHIGWLSIHLHRITIIVDGFNKTCLLEKELRTIYHSLSGYVTNHGRCICFSWVNKIICFTSSEVSSLCDQFSQ